MKLIMTLLVRNEEDILETNIKYHLNRGIDFIIAMDNLSDDGSPDILDKYYREGVLYKLYQENTNYQQDIWVGQMGHLAIEKYKADWIIHNDADEFWWPKNGSIKDHLRQVPSQEKVASAVRFDFIPVDKQPWLKTQIYRDVESTNFYGRRILPKVCHKSDLEIKMKPGNHKALLNNEALTPAKLNIEILHFPIRSYSQFEKKIKLGGAAINSNPIWKRTPTLGLWLLYRQNKLKNYYLEKLITSKSNQIRLKKGLIVKDTRLLDFMA